MTSHNPYACLDESKRSRITLAELRDLFHPADYQALVALVARLQAESRLVPIKSGGLNGMTPYLHNRYTVIRRNLGQETLKKELMNELCLQLSPDYYLSHLAAYAEDREEVFLLSDYYRYHRDLLATAVAINERSFEIWGKEKFLKDGRGRTILGNVGLTMKDMNVYETPEPFVYYSSSKKDGQSVLVIENKDTWYSLRRYLQAGHATVFGVPVDTIIYSSGKGRVSSLSDYDLSVEDYLQRPARMLYWGDLDYEGLHIFESIQARVTHLFDLEPFVPAYERMLSKASNRVMPLSKEGQNRNIKGVLLTALASDSQAQASALLGEGRYIPQEIITYADLLPEGGPSNEV